MVDLITFGAAGVYDAALADGGSVASGTQAAGEEPGRTTVNHAPDRAGPPYRESLGDLGGDEFGRLDDPQAGTRFGFVDVPGRSDQPCHERVCQIKSQGITTLPDNAVLLVTQWGALRDRFISTAILVFLVFAITDAATPRRWQTSLRSSWD